MRITSPDLHILYYYLYISRKQSRHYFIRRIEEFASYMTGRDRYDHDELIEYPDILQTMR